MLEVTPWFVYLGQEFRLLSCIIDRDGDLSRQEKNIKEEIEEELEYRGQSVDPGLTVFIDAYPPSERVASMPLFRIW